MQDVLVIGFGPAGAAAAIAAHDAGARARPRDGPVATASGGPRRDAQARVLRPDGTPIPGLYAAGGAGSVWGHLTEHGADWAMHWSSDGSPAGPLCPDKSLHILWRSVYSLPRGDL